MDLQLIEQKMLSKDLTKEEAIAISESKKYKEFGMAIWAVLQLNQKKLCCEFSYFRKCVEFACGRPVWNHEFMNPDALYAEIINLKKAPTMEEIVNMLPQEKLVVIEVPESDG